MTKPQPLQIDQLLARIDWDLQTLFKMVERLCAEAHLDDASIEQIMSEKDSARLEIISDTADEVLVKATSLITEARLAIRTIKGAVA
ncbi:hypothetical protein [Frigidibacter oleivorans]|uniref:hypothetical protein n=1 Tax=Frigidibacter oleivorans TaxID=2487129 RepID=UPI000F8C3953|nr:hypothetical protein [Frigidibacter oleivorans]